MICDYGWQQETDQAEQHNTEQQLVEVKVPRIEAIPKGIKTFALVVSVYCIFDLWSWKIRHLGKAETLTGQASIGF